VGVGYLSHGDFRKIQKLVLKQFYEITAFKGPNSAENLQNWLFLNVFTSCAVTTHVASAYKQYKKKNNLVIR